MPNIHETALILFTPQFLRKPSLQEIQNIDYRYSNGVFTNLVKQPFIPNVI